MHCLDGPLHSLGQVVVNGLHLGVRLESVCSQLPPDAALLEASKWHSSVKQCVLVHPDRSGVELGSKTGSLAAVIGEDSCCQTI